MKEGFGKPNNTSENSDKDPVILEANKTPDKEPENKTPEGIKEIRELAEEVVGSAESKGADLIEDGHNEIKKAENNSGLPAEEIAEIGEEVGLSFKLNKIKNNILELFNSLKRKIMDEMSFGGIQEYKDETIFLNENKETSRLVIEEAIGKRNEIFESRGLLQMSKEDFEIYFASDKYEPGAKMEQGNVGDCYLVAALHAMSCSPHFELICRSSMKKLGDGSWEVKLPLLSERGEVVIISPEELLPQENKQFSKLKSNGEVDTREELRPLKGKEGLLVLEASFIKRRFGAVDRLASEGGRANEVLQSFGGDNFEMIDLFMEDDGDNLAQLDGFQMANLDHDLENFDPEINMATVGTRERRDKSEPKLFEVRGTNMSLGRDHSYSITSVDWGNKEITLGNPWDTSKPIKMTIEQFKENFDTYRSIRVNSAKILKNMKKFEQVPNVTESGKSNVE